MDTASIIEWGGFLIIALLVFAETGLLVGLVVPGGETLVFTAGLLVSTGSLRVSITVLLASLVLAGIAAYVLYQKGLFRQEMANELGHVKPDHAYPVLLNLLPNGLRGLSFAALTAAIVASLAGKANSISTIFTLDIFQKFISPNATEKRLVSVGKVTVVAAMAIGVVVAPTLRNLDQGFQYIQEYTGFISPGVLAIFLLGFFWKWATALAAVVAALLTIPLSTFLKFQFEEIPFLDRMAIIFVLLVDIMVLLSLLDPGSKDNPKGLEIDASMFRPNTGFVVGSLLICGMLSALYIVFW